MDAEEQTTLVGRWLIKSKNHPVVAILIMLSIIIVGVSTVLESAGNINIAFFKAYYKHQNGYTKSVLYQ